MDRARTVLEHEAFRNVLQSFARPGTARKLASSISDRMAALDLLADCLMDSECALSHLWGEDLSTANRISTRTGCRLLPADQAEFVLAGIGGAGLRIAELRVGDPDYPDRGSTLLYLAEEIHPDGGSWWWSGPGIQSRLAPSVTGVPDGEWSMLRLANSSYPCGVDAIFLDRDGRVAALPRSTRLEEVR
jgi:alpha-D-ribose 1-methylphosphonate 5-triphosphate synthase subunit PhnH